MIRHVPTLHIETTTVLSDKYSVYIYLYYTSETHGQSTGVVISITQYDCIRVVATNGNELAIVFTMFVLIGILTICSAGFNHLVAW